jgi:DinB superfamily
MALSQDIEAMIERLRSCDDEVKLQELIDTTPPEAHTFQPTSSDWSMVRILQHLGDVEEMRHMRFNRMLTEDNPILDVVPGTPGERDSGDARVLLARWRRLRRESLDTLFALSEEQWHRVGTQLPDPQVNRTAPAPTSVLREAHKIDHHSADHLQQMQRNYETYKQSK